MLRHWPSNPQAGAPVLGLGDRHTSPRPDPGPGVSQGRLGLGDFRSAVAFQETRPNLLLAGLPAEEEKRLDGLLVRAALPVGQVLHSPGAPIDHVWFPERTAISLSVDADRRRLVELALVGREGAVGLAALFGPEVRAHHHAVVQIPGTAFAVGADQLRGVLADCPELRARCIRFAHALVGQISRTGACNVCHTLPQRLALRLLLRCDRAESGELSLTQEAFAAALGVRRAGVAVAISGLQRSGAIQQRRRRIVVRDRFLLEQVACECYATVTRLRDGESARLRDADSTPSRDADNARLRDGDRVPLV